MLGGLGRVKGPIIGTVIFFFVIQFVDNILQQGTTRRGRSPEWLVDGNNFGVVKNIVAGVSLGLLVVFRPQGIFGDKREQVFDVR